MNILNQMGVLLTDLPVVFANGCLVVLYGLAAHSAALVSIASALVIALLPDAEIQKRAGFRPERGDSRRV